MPFSPEILPVSALSHRIPGLLASTYPAVLFACNEMSAAFWQTVVEMPDGMGVS
jgi:hypothetical protein